jgi:hypothetical protein
MSTQRNDKVWIGLFGVIDLTGGAVLDGDRGAFVNALAVAKNEAEFVTRVKKTLAETSLDVFEVEDVEPLADRSQRLELSHDILALGDRAAETGEVVFDSFHTWTESDA